MYKELCLYHLDQDISHNKLQELLQEACGAVNFDAVTTHPNFISLIRGFVPASINLGCVIDYPLGVLEPEIRKFAVISAIKQKVKFIDIVAPYSLIQPGHISEFREDIESLVGLCYENNVEPRLMIDYRLHFKSITLATCHTAKQCGFAFISPSTGTYNDDIFDNIIISKEIEKETGLKCILSGHINKTSQLAVSEASGVYGARFYSLPNIKRLFGVV